MENRIPDLDKKIIYEDNDLLIVDKPFDIPTSGKTLADDDSVQFWLQQRHGSMIWAVHQLDADTTGLNIFVKKRHLVQLYKGYLSQPDSVKYYLAIVHGKPKWHELDEYSKIGYIDSQSLGVCDHGKTAHSHFEVIDYTDDFSLMKVRIFSGRTHQIRIHLSHLGHPLVGEEWYCNPPCKLHRRQALHAWQILLNSNPPQHFIAPPSDDFTELAGRLEVTQVLRNL
ncbi:MAG: RluA family pseudouridine synthase [Victivallaceae bacterium]|nr:RluA family pseudouridine synthase [Victivallaceae bacterium]